MDKFLSANLNDVRRLAENGFYDYIIVGSGMGGGVLAQHLLERYPTNSKVLILERGGTTFTTHCLNGPRPHWSHNIPDGPSQDVDIVFNALKVPVNTVSQGSYPHVGGEMHCLGGKGNVWGLYSPKIHPEQLKEHFPEEICSYLLDGYGYDRAYRLLSNDHFASIDKPYPDNGTVGTDAIEKIGSLIGDLDAGTKEWGCAFTNCPIAAEFGSREPDRALYQFSMGAFSPVNFIMDRVYNRDERLTVLTNTRAVAVNRGADPSVIVSITVLDPSGVEREIPVGKAKVILSAGTLGTPSIVLKSGLGEGCRPASPSGALAGRGLTDHDIWGTRFSIVQGPHLMSLRSQPLKLNSWVRFGDEPVLVNIAVNADTFMKQTQDRMVAAPSRPCELGEVFEEELGIKRSVVQVAFSIGAPLEDSNRVLNLPEPGTTIQIEKVRDNSVYIPLMQRLARDIGAALGRADGREQDQRCPLPAVGKAGFGVVGHEVGTMRMGEGGKGVVDGNLKMNGLENLYICDLSVFPVSPSANPSLTLVALAQRLGDHLLCEAPLAPHRLEEEVDDSTRDVYKLAGTDWVLHKRV